MGKSKIITPIITGLVIASSLFLTIIVKLKTEFQWNLLLLYIGAGFVLFIYSFLLQRFKMFLASNLLLFFALASSVYLFVAMPIESVGFDQLAVFIGWIFLTVASIALPPIIELAIRARKKAKK